MKAKICFVLLLMLVLAEPIAGFASPASSSATCPVMLGERVKKKFYADYQDVRYYFCCRSCVKKFNKNPAKYLIQSK